MQALLDVGSGFSRSLRYLAPAGLIALLATPAYAQAPAAAASKTRPHVVALAGDQLEGRLVGSNGERRASEYLVRELQRMGARPLPGRDSFLLPFQFTAGTRDGGSKTTITSGGRSRSFDARTDVQALSFSDNGEVRSSDVVFAGYGIVVPEGQAISYDSYATLDVKDKIVVVLRYFPEDAETATKAVLSRYADLRYKAMAARQRGAKAMLVVTGPSSPNAGQVIPMSFDTALAGSGIVAASISSAVADAMFGSLNDPAKTLAAAQKAMDDANPHAAGFALPGLDVSITTNVVREQRTGNNVVAYLPATAPTSGVSKPWVALGAHYDHLGHGENGSSLADKADAGKIHYGADDNASGTAAVLAVGDALAGQPRRRNVILALWSGEEIGLVGSNAFVTTPPVPLDQLAAYINFDMVGRVQDNKLTVQAAGTSDAWGRLLEQANVAAGFDLIVQRDPYQPTDVASFNLANVPCLNFFTGTHVDYHKPSDTADKINYEDLDRVAEFAAAIVRRIGDAADAPVFTRVDQASNQGGRAGVRVFTGTIPDYATDVKGLLLGGVIGGGPAEAAGLQKGDVLIEIAGQTIANIYDYTYVLDVLKIGEPVKVVYMRGATRRETTLTPAARR
jgi:hypothetical protein